MDIPSWLQETATGRIYWILPVLTIGPMVIVAALVATGWFSLKDVATFVDATLKLTAALVGSAWAANRFVTLRTDAPQLRVEGDVSRVPPEQLNSSDGRSLLLCHVRAENTGSTLIAGYDWSLQVHALRSSDDARLLTQVKEHQLPPIEPRSWAAIDLPMSAPPDVVVIRLVVQVRKSQGVLAWSWQKTYCVGPGENA